MDITATELPELPAGLSAGSDARQDPAAASSAVDIDALWVTSGEYGTVLDLNRAPRHLDSQMISVLTDFMDYCDVEAMRGRYPLWLLASHAEDIKSASSLHSAVLSAEDDDAEVDPDDQSKVDEVRMFRDILVRAEGEMRAARAAFAKNIGNGVVSFTNLPMLLAEGARLTVREGDTVWGGIIRKVARKGFLVVWYDVEIELLHAIQGQMTVSTRSFTVREFKGLAALADLSFTVMGADETPPEWMTERGMRVAEFCTPGTIGRYSGELVQQSYWHDRRYRAHGRVIVDPNHFQSMAPDLWSSAVAVSEITIEERERRGSRKQVGMELGSPDAWRVWPYLYGFSLAIKQWGRLNIDDLKPVSWRTDAFQNVVMPERDKRVVHALVANHGGGFQDIVDDKGGGLIFLLAGPPGEGKTLLAETVAETLKRPLLSISAGQLGTDPGELENTLREILDLATAWNAVILLDEADIYLEQRDSTSILRNAMVGVFLRLLEYHQGVLFLTTNRAENIDEAFYSRISVAIRYPAGDAEKRRQVWTNLILAAGEDVGLVEEVYHQPMNGRQIKTCIRMGQTLARADGKTKIEKEHLAEAIDFATRFSVTSKA